MDAFIRLAPRWMKVSLEVLLNVIGAAVSGVLIYLSVLFVKDTIAYEQLSPAMQIPMYLPYLAMPVGLSFAVVHFLHDVVKLFATGRSRTAPRRPRRRAPAPEPTP